MAAERDSLRVYLDAGTINDIADGKLPPADVDMLIGCMTDAHATLVLSLAHFADFYRRTDQGTRERVYDAIDRFPQKGIAPSGILEAEAHALDGAMGTDAEDLESTVDLKVMSFADVRQDVVPHVGDAERFGSIAEQSTDARDAGRQARLGGGVPSRAQRQVTTEFMERLMTSSPEEIVDAAILLGEQHGQLVDREAMMSVVKAVHDAMKMGGLEDEIESTSGTAAQLAETFAREGVRIPLKWAASPRGLERWMRVAPVVAPGSYLRAHMTSAREADPRRRPRASDSADDMHVEMLPYVDVATFDRETFGLLAKFAGTYRTRRAARAVRNGAMADLLDAIRSIRGGNPP